MRVVLPIDGSDCSLVALDSVVGRQWQSDAEFRVLSVVEPAKNDGAEEGPQYVPYLDAAQQELFKQARELVNERVEYLKRELPHNKIVGKVIEADVVDSIVDEASQWGADLIIVGSHGRSGVHRVLLGSVAEGVVSKAPCTVEVIRKPAHKANRHDRPAGAATS